MERKITSKSATGISGSDIAKLGRKEKTALYTIMGVCNGTKEIETDYGPATGLRGQFEAQSLLNGEIITAPIYWPPAFVADVINGELLAGKGDNNFAVHFAYTIGVKPDEGTQLGYIYFVDSLTEPDAADPFENMREALPAPAKLPAIEDKSKGKK